MKADDPIRRLLEAYKTAVHAKDLDAFVTLYRDDVHIFDLWGRWSCEGLAAWRTTILDWFGSLGDGRVVVEWQDVQMIVGREISVLHAFVNYAGLSAEGHPLRSMTNRLTWTLTHKDGAWKIAHEHTSAPASHDTLKVVLQR